MAGGDRSALDRAREWHRRRANKRSLAQFGEVWAALQHVGDALAEAQQEAKRADDPKWRPRRQRHWDLATVDEIRGSLRSSKFSLRVLVNQLKKFEPELIAREWRR